MLKLYQICMPVVLKRNVYLFNDVLCGMIAKGGGGGGLILRRGEER